METDSNESNPELDRIREHYELYQAVQERERELKEQKKYDGRRSFIFPAVVGLTTGVITSLIGYFAGSDNLENVSYLPLFLSVLGGGVVGFIGTAFAVGSYDGNQNREKQIKELKEKIHDMKDSESYRTAAKITDMAFSHQETLENRV